MNILHRRRISRRTLLHGMGVSLALPWLEIMQPRPSLLAAAAETPVRAKRAVFVFVPNGMYMPDFIPAKAGKFDGALPPMLASLENCRADFSVLSGLANTSVMASLNGAKHGLASPSFLTCVHPNETEGSDIRVGVSVDQMIACRLEEHTRLPSLELSIESAAGSGDCNLNCAYTSSISWPVSTAPAPREISPRAVFDHLFFDAAVDRSAVARRQRSVLDYVREEARALEAQLGRADLVKLGEFLENVRAVEKQIDDIEKLAPPPASLGGREAMPILPPTFAEHTSLMIELLVLALATDSTRVASLMLGNEFSNRRFPEIGIPHQHHEISHYGVDADPNSGRLLHFRGIGRHYMSFFGRLVEKMKAQRVGDGTLLDESLVLFGCGMGDANQHDFRELPILLAGHGGNFRPGQHYVFPKETPLANLHLGLLEQFDVPCDRFGDSTAKLPQVFD